ncbi:hypothetical protein PSTT_11654 [Puccinia striiformis]|uniref:Uncharacterized protein n=1 Tax=Puccinia striiformis TaxID=27350 RepID=A0A2S4UZB3_9BASI|nr:hypothetical protein PSTT_11654 [Puccinia striiformis]
MGAIHCQITTHVQHRRKPGYHRYHSGLRRGKHQGKKKRKPRCKTQRVFVKTLLLNGEGDDGAAKLCPSMLSENKTRQALLSDRVKFELNCLMTLYVRLKAMGAMLQPMRMEDRDERVRVISKNMRKKNDDIPTGCNQC